MRTYEVAYIADPEMDEQSLAELEERVKGWIEAEDGKTIGVDRWGRRRQAYQINKQSEGVYVFVKAEMPAHAGQVIERNLQLNEQVLRFLITAQEPA